MSKDRGRRDILYDNALKKRGRAGTKGDRTKDVGRNKTQRNL